VTDERPRPEYGEYATPEEQAAAIGTVPEAMQDITPQAVVPEEQPRPALSPARRRDLIASVALIVIGAWITFSSLAQYANLQATIEQVYTGYGYTGTYADPALASAVGITLNIVQPVALAIAAIFTARRLRAGKVAFWIPLVAGVVVSLISLALIVVVFAADPAFMAFAQKAMGS
jgi:hypothetical protein